MRWLCTRDGAATAPFRLNLKMLKRSSKRMNRTPFRTVLKQRTSFKHRRPKKTVEGDTARMIRDECDQLVREILILDFCFTCGSSEEVHPGHYITRKVYALRWDMTNLRPQCNRCNSEHNLDRSRYRSRLVKDIGLSKVEELERIGRDNPRVEFSELLAIRDELREKRRLRRAA